MLSVAWGVLRRDLHIALRRRSVIAWYLFFFILVVALFPLGMQADNTLLSAVAPALIWMALLLSSLLSLQSVFQDDFEDGTLDQYLLSPAPLALIVLAKIIAHWLSGGLIAVFVSPLLFFLLGLPTQAFGPSLAALALGTPLLALIGAIGAGLTLSLPQSGILLSLLIFPLYVPVMIFGAGTMHAAITGLPVAGPLYLLAALLVLGLTLAPLAIAAALRINLE
jgi:heme exporter protein B